jgi:hypothetical protein
MKPIGATRWAIAEGYIPGDSTRSSRELTSHETVCILNARETNARVEITVFFADRSRQALFYSPSLPVGPSTFASMTFEILRRSRSKPTSPVS